MSAAPKSIPVMVTVLHDAHLIQHASGIVIEAQNQIVICVRQNDPLGLSVVLNVRANNLRAGNEQQNKQQQNLALKKSRTSAIVASKTVSEKFPGAVAAEVKRRISWQARATVRLVTSAATFFQRCSRLSHDSSAPGALSFPIVAGLRIFFFRKLSRSFEKCRIGVERLPLIAILRTGIAHALLPLVTVQRQRGRLH